MKTALYILGSIYVAGVLIALSFGVSLQAAMLWPVNRFKRVGVSASAAPTPVPYPGFD